VGVPRGELSDGVGSPPNPLEGDTPRKPRPPILTRATRRDVRGRGRVPPADAPSPRPGAGCGRAPAQGCHHSSSGGEVQVASGETPKAIPSNSSTSGALVVSQLNQRLWGARGILGSMPNPKRPRDPNQRAKLIVDIATGGSEEPKAPPQKDRAAVELGRRGG